MVHTSAMQHKCITGTVMDKDSGKIQKASAHATCLIVMYRTAGHRDRRAAALYVEASTLPNKEGMCHGARRSQRSFIQRGDG